MGKKVHNSTFTNTLRVHKVKYSLFFFYFFIPMVVSNVCEKGKDFKKFPSGK